MAAAVGDRHRQAALHSRLADVHHAAGSETASMKELEKSVALFSKMGTEPGQIEPEVWMLTRW